MWKKLNERLAYRGWRKIKVKAFELPDGRKAEFDIISSASYVTVAAFTEKREAILVRQFRPGPERELLSFSEGAIDPGELPEQAARRELMEETGFEAAAIRFLKKKESAYTDQTQHFYLATGCTFKQAPQPDATEFLKVELLSLEGLKRLLEDPEEDSFCNIDAAYLAMQYLKD